VCYGVHGDVLPSASEVVQLYVSNGITGMRIYFPDAKALHALSGTDIGIIMDVGNGNLAALASGPGVAYAWVLANVKPHHDVNIKYIAVGNEVPEQGGNTKDVLPAMKNMHDALSRAGLGGIKVSTAVHSGVTAGFPPSQGTFSANASHMPPIAQYLASIGAPLLANVYPYFAFMGTPGIDINYALFTSSGTVVQDGGKAYQNLFDALVDTFYYALESAGAGSERAPGGSARDASGSRGAAPPAG
jgi:hypothetical protein